MVKQFLVSSLLPFLGVLAPWRFAPVLAQIDVLNLLMLVVCVFNTVASLILGVVLYKMQQTVNSFNRAEDKSDQEIKALSAGLHDAATKLIDERFRAISHQFANAMQGLVNTMDEVKRRLADGDGEFDALDDRDHQLELKVGQKIEGVKDYVRQEIGRHEEHGNGRFNTLGESIAKLGREVAVLADRSDRGSRNAE